MTMMASEFRVCYRLYMPWQEDLRTAWLQKMAREGWHLVSVCGIRYEFIKGNPHRLAMPVNMQPGCRRGARLSRIRSGTALPAA